MPIRRFANSWASSDELEQPIRLQAMIDALTFLEHNNKPITPSDLIHALLTVHVLDGGNDDISSTASATERNSDSDDNSIVIADQAPATPPVVPTSAPTASPNVAAAAAAIPSVAIAVAAATAPPAHPLALLPPGDHQDPSTGVRYYLPPLSSISGRWYSVTHGRRVGVFHSWATVAPYVVGVASVCYAKFNNRDEAVVAFATALAARGVTVV
ncbi:hypothetical protein BJ165DRAFT_1463995 [Panaeolus papilionaceus]|nr:hypothetical protein BJ165DRAFT_1463995 [Panaeolus papilionaceus]